MQPKSRQERAADRRRQILDAAVQAFAQHGFFHTRVSEIARRAGVADGTIYLYFKSKDDILIAVFEERMEQILRELEDAVAHLEGAGARLEGLLRMYLSLVERDPALAEVITVELRQSGTFIREYANPGFKRLMRLFARVLEEGAASGELRADVDPRLAARALFGMLDEISLWGVLRPHPFDPDEVAASLATILLGGLRATPAPPARAARGSAASRPSPPTAPDHEEDPP